MRWAVIVWRKCCDQLWLILQGRRAVWSSEFSKQTKRFPHSLIDLGLILEGTVRSAGPLLFRARCLSHCFSWFSPTPRPKIRMTFSFSSRSRELLPRPTLNSSLPYGTGRSSSSLSERQDSEINDEKLTTTKNPLLPQGIPAAM